MKRNLNRFLKPQEQEFKVALSQIKAGRKIGHWMWYIFPQFKGLGFSETSKFYAIQDLEEAREFLKHPILGTNLKQICNALLKLEENNALKVMGSPDDLKLKSSLTLFTVVAEKDETIFQKVLNKYFDGEVDDKTLQLFKENFKN